MRKYTLKPASLYIIVCAMLLLAAAATVLAREYLGFLKILMYSLIGLCWGLVILFGFILLPMYFRRTVIYISQSEITVHTGIVFLERNHMKMSAVQYATKIAFPLSGFSGFNFIVVRALGGNLMLPFLNSVDCEEIISALHLEIEKRGSE